MKRAVVTTSSSCLEALGLLQGMDILRLHVNINNVDFIDGKNITSERLATIMKTNLKSVARTFPPSIHEMHLLFNDLIARGVTEVFVCGISSKFSQTLPMLEELKVHYANRLHIFVYDTKTLNIAEGALAYEAKVLIEQGESFENVAKKLDDLRRRSEFLFTLSDLDYIIRNKKLSAPAAFVANLFDIKPIMQINQIGEIIAVEKVRKLEKTLTTMGKTVEKLAANQPAFIYLTDTGHHESTEFFKKILAMHFGWHDLPVIRVSTISLANHGLMGTGIGVFYGELPHIVKALKK